MIENATICHSDIQMHENTIDAASGALSLSNCTIWSDGINGSSILISSTLLFVTSRAPLFGVSPSNVGPFDMVIAYRETTTESSESLGLCEGPFLQVGNLNVPQDGWPSFEFCVWKGTIGRCLDNGRGRIGNVIAYRDVGEKSFERCFDNGTGRIRSVIVRSLAAGTYSFPGWISGHEGMFSSADGQMDFAVDLNLNSSFVDVLLFGGVRPTCVFRVSASDILEGRKSVGFEVSRLEWISTRFGESVTVTFAWDSRSHFQSGDEAEVIGSTAVWIGAGISLAALLLVIVVISLLLGCRPWLLEPVTDATESEMESNMPADGEVRRMP
jgi:hypothetical protein